MQSLNCKCGSGMVLINDVHVMEANDKIYNFHNAFKLKCVDESCGKMYLTDSTKELCDVIINEMPIDDIHDKNVNLNFLKIAENLLTDKFPLSGVEFTYDRNDYYFIPGLIRPWNKGNLTPVFFDLNVLIKYMYHSDYSLELGANTYGAIYHNGEHMISFGINPNNRVIMWLCDINDLSIEEQYYLRSENVISDHNIVSEFYEGQIETMFANPSDLKKIFINRKDLFEACLHKYETPISQLNTEILNVVNKVARPIIGTEEAFREVIIPMNMILVESHNVKSMKAYLQKDKARTDIKGLKGNKLFGEFWSEVLGVRVDEDISPLFVLYDLRIAFAHLQSEETKEEMINFACKRLSLPEDCRDYILIFDTLVNELNKMYTKLLKGV